MRRGLSAARMNPTRSAPASTATSTSSWRVRPHTLTSGRCTSSRSFAPGSAARINVEPTSTAFAPASSAAAACARVSIPLSAITTRSRGARATSSSCPARSTWNVPRSRAFTPMTGASNATARASSAVSCASTSVSSPSSLAAPISVRAVASSRSRKMRRAASAPASRASRRCSVVEKNPFARSGRPVAARAARRSFHEPSKRSSTSTDIARAPPLS